MAAQARWAISGWSAATAAIGSPWKRMTSLANTGWSWCSRPYVGLPGTSSAVTTALTPCIRRAGSMSTERMRAAGCGLRRVRPHSMPSIHRSEEKANWPFTLGIPSGRSTLSPTPGARRPRVKVDGRLGAGMGTLLLDASDGFEDAAVAGAAAQVPGDRLADLQLAGVRPAL